MNISQTAVSEDWTTAVSANHSLFCYPEPLPSWDEALSAWKWAWHVHTYGFSAAFIGIDVIALMSVFMIRRRLAMHPGILLISGTLFTLGGLRVLFLLIDPYGSRNIIQIPLLRLLYSAVLPCLTTAFCLVQVVLLRITRVKGPTPRLKQYRLLFIVIFIHFATVIFFELIVSYHVRLKLLLLICQCMFITWGLVLCFGFIYNGFKVAQFTTETRKALEQLTIYNKVKREISRDGNRKELALHRISKPKIRSEEEEHREFSDGFNTSDFGSSDELSFFNNAHFILDDHQLQQVFNEYHLAKRVPKRKLKDFSNNNSFTTVHLTTNTTSNYDISSDSDNRLTYSPSIAGSTSQELKLVTSEETRDDVNLSKDTLSEIRDSNSQPDKCESFTIEHDKVDSHTYINQGYESKYSLMSCTHKPLVNGYMSVAQDTSQEIILTLNQVNEKGDQSNDVDEKPNHSNNENEKSNQSNNGEEIVQESGYMADTEICSPKPKRKKGFTLRTRVQVDNDDEIEISSSPIRKPFRLPDNDGTLGLYRIRQGSVLRLSLRATYATTLFGFICCVLQLYAMFGVYGVLSNQIVARPWPWYLFQTGQRLGELCMSYSIAYTTFSLAANRGRHRKRKRSVLKTEQTSKC